MRVKPERKIVLELHIKLFPEEYDFLKDYATPKLLDNFFQI